MADPRRYVVRCDCGCGDYAYTAATVRPVPWVSSQRSALRMTRAEARSVARALGATVVRLVQRRLRRG